jgi:hypothetical protein
LQRVEDFLAVFLQPRLFALLFARGVRQAQGAAGRFLFATAGCCCLLLLLLLLLLQQLLLLLLLLLMLL